MRADRWHPGSPAKPVHELPHPLPAAKLALSGSSKEQLFWIFPMRKLEQIRL